MRKQTQRIRNDVQKAMAVKQEPGILEPSETIGNTFQSLSSSPGLTQRHVL